MSRRLLVVDDDRHMVSTFCDILRLHGWEADGAHSGAEALEAVERQAYRVVLMDVRMPGMNGVEALSAMRTRQPAVHVILMTAYTATELLDEAEREGALAVIPKPVPIPALVRVLEETIRDRSSVLVVDDDPAFLDTLCTILREGGFEVLEASSLGEALDRLREESPVVVLLDLRLDSMEPRDSVMAIRRVSPVVTLILYSGHPSLLRRTTEALPPPWIHAALHKPFSPERLIDLLDAVLQG